MTSQGPQPVSEAVRRSMQANRSKNSSPEMALRQVLYGRGLRYRIHQRPEPKVRCTADVVFRSARVAVFVDGCFWHRCPIHGTSPKMRAEWWAEKLDGNVARDRRNDATLTAAGWNVVRVWEHEDPETAAHRIQRAVEDGTRSKARNRRSSRDGNT